MGTNTKKKMETAKTARVGAKPGPKGARIKTSTGIDRRTSSKTKQRTKTQAGNKAGRRAKRGGEALKLTRKGRKEGTMKKRSLGKNVTKEREGRRKRETSFLSDTSGLWTYRP